MEPLLTVQLQHFYVVLLGGGVHLAPLDAGVDEGVESCLGDDTRLVGGHRLIHLGEHTLGEVVGLHLLLLRQLRHFGGHAPVAGHVPLDQTLMGQTVGADALLVADAVGVVQGQGPGGSGFQKALL